MVTARAYDTFVRIDVQDEGPGIPEEEANEIWKRFTRGKIAADGADGVGIGLYLTRAIITAQGGRAFCHTTETGAVFSMMMPRYETVKRKQKEIGGFYVVPQESQRQVL